MLIFLIGAKIDGEYNKPTLNFFMRRDTEMSGPRVIIWMNGGAVTAFRDLTLTTDQWSGFSFALGPYQDTPENADPWQYSGPTDWTDVDSIRFKCTCAANANLKQFWVDGFHISGYLLRAARQSAAFSSTDPAKIKLITDNVGKDDSLIKATDTGLMARFAKAEVLRSKTTPTLGFIVTPCIKDLLPGQLLHVHAKKISDGTFNINTDMRVTQLIHNFSVKGFTTKIFLTNDVTNSIARTSFSDYNKTMAAARPEFQDRQASSIKTRMIDITQPILENSY